jgi:hypothetical protein
MFLLMQGNGSGADSHNPYEATLVARRELHRPGSERSCLHAELDLGSSQVRSPHPHLYRAPCCTHGVCAWHIDGD